MLCKGRNSRARLLRCGSFFSQEILKELPMKTKGTAYREMRTRTKMKNVASGLRSASVVA